MPQICLSAGRSISGFAAISRYRERELVSHFRQHIWTDETYQFPGLGDCHVESPASPHSASMHRGLHAEVVPQDRLQPLKILRPEALSLEEHRSLPSIARAIVYEPNCERLRVSEQRSDRLGDDLPAVRIEEFSKFSQVRMAPRHKPPEGIPTVVVLVQGTRSKRRELPVLPRDVRFVAGRVIHLEPDASAVWLEISIPQHSPDQRLLH